MTGSEERFMMGHKANARKCAGIAASLALLCSLTYPIGYSLAEDADGEDVIVFDNTMSDGTGVNPGEDIGGGRKRISIQGTSFEVSQYDDPEQISYEQKLDMGLVPEPADEEFDKYANSEIKSGVPGIETSEAALVVDNVDAFVEEKTLRTQLRDTAVVLVRNTGMFEGRDVNLRKRTGNIHDLASIPEGLNAALRVLGDGSIANLYNSEIVSNAVGAQAMMLGDRSNSYATSTLFQTKKPYSAGIALLRGAKLVASDITSETKHAVSPALYIDNAGSASITSSSLRSEDALSPAVVIGNRLEGTDLRVTSRAASAFELYGSASLLFHDSTATAYSGTSMEVEDGTFMKITDAEDEKSFDLSLLDVVDDSGLINDTVDLATYDNAVSLDDPSLENAEIVEGEAPVDTGGQPDQAPVQEDVPPEEASTHDEAEDAVPLDADAQAEDGSAGEGEAVESGSSEHADGGSAKAPSADASTVDFSSSKRVQFVNSFIETGAMSSGRIFDVSGTSASVLLHDTKMTTAQDSDVELARLSSDGGAAGLKISAKETEMSGDVEAQDSGTIANIILASNASWTGTVKGDGSANSSVSITKDSKWVVDEDTALESLTMQDYDSIRTSDGKHVHVIWKGSDLADARRVPIKQLSDVTITVSGDLIDDPGAAIMADDIEENQIDRAGYDEETGEDTYFESDDGVMKEVDTYDQALLPEDNSLQQRARGLRELIEQDGPLGFLEWLWTWTKIGIGIR